jgi:serine/threonine-protein kinase
LRSERQQQIEELFGQVLEVAEADRQAFLQESCGENHELRASLEGLLRSDKKAGSFLANLVTEAEEEEIPQEGACFTPGSVLGPYRLQRRIGEGGMSTVFLADRVDGSFRRPVVVKVIRRGMESAETLRRLRLERQILAGLEHPNIARLYDGGTTEEHLPYFVMELVEGETIDVYCDHNRLTIPQRLLLFRKVCDAVQYAHQNLVVHRDLKPGNILVTAEGEPKLLDFGIAKLLDPTPDGTKEEPTVAWARLMTPNYASPEQVLGQRITTASDVYSLGVVLYKLLTGVLPRRFEGCSAVEMETQLTSTLPEKPSDRVCGMDCGSTAGEAELVASPEVIAASRRARPDQLRRRLAGDLDRIVLKALHPELSRRYPSAEQFGEDLRRHQEGLPVRARPDTLLYRMGKFLRRHRIVVGAATLMAIVLAVSTLAISLQSAQIAHERDQLQAVVSFVKSVFNVAGEGEKLTVRQAVDRSADVLDLEFREQPEIRATLLDVMGTIYLNLLEVDQARLQLNRAVTLGRDLFGENSLTFAESLSTLAITDALSDDHELGERRAREALAIYRHRLGENHPKLVLPLNNLVNVLCYTGDYEAAVEPSERALVLARQFLSEGRVEFGDALTFRALVFAKSGDQLQAEVLYREALELHLRYRGERHPKVATVLNNLALVLKRQGKLAEAEGFFRQAINLERELFGDDYQELAIVLNNLASLERARGKLEQAEETYREAIRVVHRIHGPSHAGALITSTGLALVLIERGKAQEAETLLRDGLALWAKSLEGSWYLAYARSVLGASLTELERYTAAEPLLQASYRELQTALGDEAPKTREARQRLSRFYQASGRSSSIFLPQS